MKFGLPQFMKGRRDPQQSVSTQLIGENDYARLHEKMVMPAPEGEIIDFLGLPPKDVSYAILSPRGQRIINFQLKQAVCKAKREIEEFTPYSGKQDTLYYKTNYIKVCATRATDGRYMTLTSRMQPVEQKTETMRQKS